MKTADQIRAEIERWKPIARVRRPKGEMESFAAAMIVQALTWALGETASPAIRVNVK